MRNCPVCDHQNAEKQLHCTACGWFFRLRAESDYRQLVDAQSARWREQWQQLKDKQRELADLLKEEEELQQKIMKVQEEKMALDRKQELLTQQIKETEEIITAYVDIIEKIDQYHEQENYLDALFQPYSNTNRDERLFCTIRKRGVVEVERGTEDESPDLMLVLGRRPLYETTEKAEFFIRLKNFVELEKGAKWSCNIPNPFELKGRYYGYLSTLHLPESRQVKVNNSGQQIDFN